MIQAGDVARMVERYGQGLSLSQVAAELGVTKTTVWKHLRAAGVATRRPVAVGVSTLDQEILQLRRQGLIWREIGATIGMSTPGVHGRWRRLRAAGHEDPMPPRPFGLERVVELYNQGLTTSQVGRELGCTGSTVSKQLRAAGVQGRKPGRRHPVEDAELLRLRSQGLLWREVAEQTGMTLSGVTSRWRLLRAAGHEDPGIPNRRRHPA